MVAQSDFEYTYRWADGLDVDALEARDQALEQHLLEGYGSSCFVDFEYPYRWGQILTASSPEEQIQLLEHNMSAIEHAVTLAGGCTLEFPFRWSQFWEALLAGESWAIGIAEENDRAIEFRFGRCVCTEGFTAFFITSGGMSATGAYISDADVTASAATTTSKFSYEATDVITGPGSVALYADEGSGEFLVATLTVPLGTSSDTTGELGSFVAGTVFRMRSFDMSTDVDIGGSVIATFSFDGDASTFTRSWEFV